MTPIPRVLLYGMQSSGASLVAYLAAQASQTLGVIDLWNPEPAPAIRYDGPLVLKATVGPVTLDEHITRMRPTALVLVLRNPVDQISVLSRETYRDYASPLETKLATFDDVVANRCLEFDLVLKYEDVVDFPARAASKLRRLGLPMPNAAHEFPRAVEDVVTHARARSEWCNIHWRSKWGTGRVDAAAIPLHRAPVRRVDGALETARRHCPHVVARYA